MLSKTLLVLGLITAANLLFRLSRFILLYTRSSSFHKYQRPHAYALVTGASAGIGKCFATELASRGLNVVLHGRNAEKMEGVRSDLAKKFPKVDFRTLIADASQSHGMKQNVEKMATALNELPGPLTILINNVGGSPSSRDPFTPLADDTPADIDAMINVNTRFTVQLTRSLLPRLTDDGPSLVLNVGSMAALTGQPFLSLYCGAKAYILVWSQALARECKASKRDIEILGLLVGAVTETQVIKTPVSLYSPSATKFVNSVFARVGCGSTLVYPHWFHAFLGWLMMSMYEPIQDHFILMNLKQAMGRDVTEGKKVA